MAKDRISSNRPSFSDTRCVDPGAEVNVVDTSAGRLAGSSPDSGSKSGAGFDGAVSSVGRAGSSISLAFELGVGDCDGESSALTAPNVDSRTKEMIACHFMASGFKWWQHIAGFVRRPQDTDRHTYRGIRVRAAPTPAIFSVTWQNVTKSR